MASPAWAAASDDEAEENDAVNTNSEGENQHVGSMPQIPKLVQPYIAKPSVSGDDALISQLVADF